MNQTHQIAQIIHTHITQTIPKDYTAHSNTEISATPKNTPHHYTQIERKYYGTQKLYIKYKPHTIHIISGNGKTKEQTIPYETPNLLQKLTQIIKNHTKPTPPQRNPKTLTPKKDLN